MAPTAETAKTDGTILVVNAGSSSIKLAVFPADDAAHAAEPRLTALIERIGAPEAAAWIRPAGGAKQPVALGAEAGRGHAPALRVLLPEIAAQAGGPIAAAGHRIVHGGDGYSGPVAIDEGVLERLETLVPLARTHQPHGIAAIRAVGEVWPAVLQIACFDTAFHATIPERARTFALPEAVRRAGVRRYGFHGLSYQWIAASLPGILGDAAEGRIVVAHLGNGASLCGMAGRESRATTMGFTPLDGLVMGERPGRTDPGAILFMLEEMGLAPAEIREMLFKRSGLLGLSGISNDMRTLMASAAPEARLALEVYVERAVVEIGAIAASIGGLDALVFTGGVGENAAGIRAAIVARLGWLGLGIDPEANAANALRLSPEGATPVLIVPANEEAVIARETRGLALAAG
ncbi:acetate/propionate family kinase [Paralimibaculum aggregatum]|uniref:Acetate kinase n=1 Tax=Paralimibaculum aggregatum TaxID=3036245 RepID=A0ABQ6LPZ0_9RHOB|nr:acetate/propionate family kinase [Limibaculum sp. NKW23]GMG83932.1 acetate/propionate family kinase [Limibaculum sp. NKW23]